MAQLNEAEKAQQELIQELHIKYPQHTFEFENNYIYDPYTFEPRLFLRVNGIRLKTLFWSHEMGEDITSFNSLDWVTEIKQMVIALVDKVLTP